MKPQKDNPYLPQALSYDTDLEREREKGGVRFWVQISKINACYNPFSVS